MKRKLLFVLTLIFFTVATKAQKQSENKEGIVINEKMPHFPGGDKAFYNYLDKNVKTPETFDKETYLKEHGNQYVPVAVIFTIDTDGSIINVKVKEKVNEQLDEKAIQIVKNMPKWEPGYQNGKSVKVQYAIPIRFNLKQ